MPRPQANLSVKGMVSLKATGGKAVHSCILGISFAGLIYSFHLLDSEILKGSNYYYSFT